MKEVFPYGKGLPINLSTQGGGIDWLISFLHVFMFTLFIGWGIYFVYVLWRFRARKGQSAIYEPIKGKTTKYLEVAVVVIEVILLFGISMPIWARFKTMPEKDENAIEVRVLAEQFAWNFHYPGKDGIFGKTSAELIDTASNPVGLDRDNDPHAADDFYSVNVMRVPANKPVIAHITSKDVIHSFFIPVMRVKQDAVPGLRASIWFEAREPRYNLVVTEGGDKPEEVISAVQKVAPSLGHKTAEELVKSPSVPPKGVLRCVDRPTAEAGLKILEAAGGKGRIEPTVFDIACAQLCGLGHYKMRGMFSIVSDEEYAAWSKDALEASGGVEAEPASAQAAAPAAEPSAAAPAAAPAAAQPAAPASVPSDDPNKNDDGFDN